MPLLAVTGCCTNPHMLEPGRDKRADVRLEMPVHRHPSPAHPASGSLSDGSDGPCTCFNLPADDVVDCLPGEGAFDANADRNFLP